MNAVGHETAGRRSRRRPSGRAQKPRRPRLLVDIRLGLVVGRPIAGDVGVHRRRPRFWFLRGPGSAQTSIPLEPRRPTGMNSDSSIGCAGARASPTWQRRTGSPATQICQTMAKAQHEGQPAQHDAAGGGVLRYLDILVGRAARLVDHRRAPFMSTSGSRSRTSGQHRKIVGRAVATTWPIRSVRPS